MTSVTIKAASEAIYKHFIDNWDESDATYTFDGEDFKEPTALPWVRVSVRNFTSAQSTLGQVANRQFERRGSVFFNVFTPIGSGVDNALTLAQLIVDLFEGVTIEGVYFFESDVREQGTDGLWYGVVVESKFTYNETK